MLVSSARALSLDDPRVGAAWVTSGAAFDTLPAGPEATSPLYPTHAASGVLEGSPYWSSLGVQVLFVARHLVWYALLRPARLAYWAGLLQNLVNLVCGGLVLLLAESSRTATVWSWWRRYRLAAILAASLPTRCVLLLNAFLLLPPHTCWTSDTWGTYVVNATSAAPEAHALAMGVYNVLDKVPLLAALVTAPAHTAAVFVLACRVACQPLALHVLLGLAVVAWPPGEDKEAAGASACKVPDGSVPAPTEAPAVCPHRGTPAAAAGAPRCSAHYHSRMASATISIKVQEHPGDYKEYGKRLASVLQDCVRQDLGSRAAAGTVLSPRPVASGPQLSSTVIRGCVQVVLWGWVHEQQGQLLGGAGANGVGDPGLVQELVRQLGRMFSQEEPASVRGVSVQVGQEVAVLGEPGQDEPLPRVPPLRGDIGGGGGGASVRLLQLTPPAVSPAAVSSTGSLTVRLLLHSPEPQMARVLVLAERVAAAGSSVDSPVPTEGSHGGRVLSQRLLLELPLQLEGGVQEVQVELGAGQLAGAGMEVGQDRAEGVAAAESDAVGVLRVMMVGPEHQAATGGGEQQGAAGAPRLVHWVAPPLLLLPPAAAAEVCGAWEAMQQEAGGCPGPAKEEQPLSGFGSEPLASAAWRSSLWWSHMAPLLGDLARALGGHRGMGQEEDGDPADPVAHTLLSYLQWRGMVEMLSVLDGRSLDQYSHRHQRTPTSAAGYLAAPPTYFPMRRQSLVPLPRPFSPPAVEVQYQQWRLERLVHMTPYALLAFDATATLILLLRALVTKEPLPEWAAPLPLRLVHIVVFMLLTTVADNLGLVVLYVRAIARPSNQRQQQQEQGRPEGAAGVAASRDTALVDRRDVVWYQLATCVAGPAVLLLCGAQTCLGLTPLDPRAVGKLRFTYGTGLNRAVIVPSLQQMSAWEAVAAAPLMWCGETLVLMHMQPAWGVWRAGAGAAVWRLVAVGVSAVWERWSRGRFVQGQQQQQAGAALGVRQGFNAGEGPGESKKRV